MSKNLRLISIFVFVSSCTTSCQVRRPSGSSTKFAYGQPDSIIGGPNGRLEILNMGFHADFSQIKICVQGDNVAIRDSEIMTETKLAHAMWLSGAGYGANEFNSLIFVAKPKCHKDDLQFSSSVVLANFANEDDADQFKSQFPEPQINCTMDDTSMSCSSKSTTYGLGSPGALSWQYFENNPNQWTKIMGSHPASVLLSPYADWTSLDRDLQSNASLDDITRQQMRTAYKSLTSSDNPTFAGLLSFATDLQNSKLTLGKDAAFDQIAQQFQASNTPKLSMGYRASMAAFHVLLHETGHTFGMMHADNPDTNDITGQSSAATKNAAGQWVTSKSTMAYGDSYAYLTDDDLAGVKAATDAIKKELATHK